MNSPSSPQPTTRVPREMFAPILLTIVVFLLGTAAFVQSRLRMNDGHNDTETGLVVTRPASAQELEELYGVRVTLIGVTAAGGMVDFRFRVVDAEKAAILFADHNSMPILQPVDSSVRMAVPNGSHSMSFENGKVYYLLFGNPGGVVRPGVPVKVTLGGLVLEPILAQ